MIKLIDLLIKILASFIVALLVGVSVAICSFLLWDMSFVKAGDEFIKLIWKDNE